MKWIHSTDTDRSEGEVSCYLLCPSARRLVVANDNNNNSNIKNNDSNYPGCLLSRQISALIMEEVQKFLEKNNLSQYVDSFADQGYDDLDQILSMATCNSELTSLMQDVGIFDKPGHRKRLTAALEILRSKTEHGVPTQNKSNDTTTTQCDKQQDDMSKCK